MATFTDALAAMNEGKTIKRAGFSFCVTRDPVMKNYGIKHYRTVDGVIKEARMEWLVSDMAANDWVVHPTPEHALPPVTVAAAS